MKRPWPTTFLFISVLFLLLSKPAVLIADEPDTHHLCSLPKQQSADGRMIAPYPVAVVDLLNKEEQEQWTENLLGCEGTTFVVIRTNHENGSSACGFNEDEHSGRCDFLIESYFPPEKDKETGEQLSDSWYTSSIEFSVDDNGGRGFKIQRCPRSGEIIATGFYQFEYLGGDYSAGAHRGRHVAVDPSRAEATWALVGDGCFNFGELQY